jgi:hypothetical protein
VDLLNLCEKDPGGKLRATNGAPLLSGLLLALSL